MKTNKVTTDSVYKFIYESTKKIELLIQNGLKKKGKMNIALSGGNTPLPIYEQLRERDIDWKNISFFLVDERCVPIASDQSNYKNISQSLFNHVPSRAFSMINNVDYETSARLYEKTIINNVESRNSIPRFDLIVLGMGIDGHTASLFPGTSALQIENDLVVINEVPELNTKRITMTFPLINNASKIVLLIKGKEKKRVLEESVEKKLPISKVLPNIDYIIS